MKFLIFSALLICMSISASLKAEYFISRVGDVSQIIPPEAYLAGRLLSNDKRYKTMKKALELLEQRQAKILVETGTARYGTVHFIGDGGSTIIFGEWAKNKQSVLYSVDISAEAIQTASTAVGPNNNVSFICQDSITFLEQFDQTIDFLYLDSYDFEIDNPTPSQEHHLKEIIAAYPRLTSKTIVMIDDCDLPGGGKGALVIPFLLERGWKILAQGYQVILVQGT